MDNVLNQKIKLVIIGGSSLSAVGLAHVSAISLDRHFIIVGAYFSTSENERNNSFKFYNLDHKIRNYSSLEEVIQQKDKFDLAVNLTPTTLHYEINSKLALNNINFISEKAITTSYEQAIKLLDLCKNKKVYSVVVFNYCAYPAVKYISELFKSNKFGEIISVELSMHQEGYLRNDYQGKLSTPQDWRLESPSIDMVSLDLGVHLLSMCSMMDIVLDEDSIFSIKKSNNRLQVIDTIYSLASSEDNYPVAFTYGKSFLGNRNGLKIKIYGSEFSAKWEQMNPENIIFSYPNGEIITKDRSIFKTSINNERFKVGHPAGFIEALANFYLDVYYDFMNYKNGKIHNTYFSLDNAVKGMKIMESI